MYLFHKFFHPLLKDSDFDAVPLIMLVGQYSTGKTSFIKYILQRDFPGIRIGPEPTTDRFVAIMHGTDERIIPGNALVMQANKPFTALAKFGSGFLNRLECAQMESKLLQKLTIIDTPGVLAGAKQETNRNYDFTKVMEWFANRSDRILVLFDAHKLDISDEFKRVLQSLKGNDDKIRVVLNKADAVTTSQLMRVYGSMMWSLGKVVNTPEVCRVYIGSFWNKPLKNKNLTQLFESEMEDLISDVKSVPRNGVLRKLNELVKRTRMAKVHAFIIGHLRENMPGLIGKKQKQQKLIANLADEFFAVKKKHDLVLGDFPNVEEFQEKLTAFDDFNRHFKRLDRKAMANLDTALEVAIPKLMAQMPTYQRDGPADDGPADASNPFGEDLGGGTSEIIGGVDWAVPSHKKISYDNAFSDLPGSESGRVTGKNAMGIMKSRGQGLRKQQLRQVWALADNDKDGKLTSEEFAVALYLLEQAVQGVPLPQTLPADLVPPSQR
jgi:GTPase SAR1 family protein